MKVFIEYIVRGETGTWTIETVFSWIRILEYKTSHAGISDDEVLDKLAQQFLEEQFGISVSLMRVYKA